MSAILNHTTTLSLGVAGDKPLVIQTGDRAETVQRLLKAHYTEGDSFVLLCKNHAACEVLYEELKSFVPRIQLITEQQKLYTKGILIMPGYMAKGFEFTTVVLADADARTYHEEMDAYLLYTIASRATRQLFFLTAGDLPKALAQVDEQYYRKEGNVSNEKSVLK